MWRPIRIADEFLVGLGLIIQISSSNKWPFDQKLSNLSNLSQFIPITLL
jgi:hypothetical protein